ncbi:MAG: metal-dependent transcriptional regulator, partial [Calditrichaeota bacterium]
MEVWKAFEKNVITHSAAHHLMTIYSLLEKNGYARVTDVAKSLEITRGSASITLKALKGKGLVVEDENKFLRLSEKGKRISQTIRSMRKISRKFLVEILRVDPAQAEIDACKIEHLLSHETGEKLLRFLKFLSSDKPEVNRFLAAFREYSAVCTGAVEECDFCDTECLMPE